jgi:arylsulfatase A-like enzyme
VTDYYNWVTYDVDAPPFTNTTYSTTALTDYAIDYINERETAQPNDPWFVYQAYNGAHAPFQVPPADLHTNDLGDAKPGQVLNTLPNYKAIIQSVDISIGRLLEEVDLEKTTVIVIGDNGTPGNQKDTGTGVRGSKGSVYEGGVRVPLIVAGAGVTRRGREDALVGSADLFATILSLAGVPVSHVENSYNFKPLFSDEAATSGRTHSFSETASGSTQRYAIRDNRYKLVSNNKVRELYDLVADPLESTDLFSDASYAAVRASLEAEISALAPNAPDGYFP